MHKQRPMQVVHEAAAKKDVERETVEQYMERGGQIQYLPSYKFAGYRNNGPARAHTNDYGGNP